ncbi:MAG: glutamate--tRNA ligase [Candidatus Cloacimonetes bacterium]|nr:glutamate--tRNA ligase [Candidatus Cloacimonadota bacterium]
MNPEIRVRFAPSPTGYLHVGSLRTALYNFLYARRNSGKFILRIEDTDQSRFVEGAVENLISTMQAVGLEYEEGPYFQSQRTEIYQDYARQLIEKGAAYHCFCTPEELEIRRQEQIERGEDGKYDGRCLLLSREEAAHRLQQGDAYVIRLRVPREGEIIFHDLVREKVVFPWDMVDDQVLIKSDGYPTYHLANVVDDHLMQITHVIRGEEWLSSVPKHLLLYQQLGWHPPKMAHLPLLLNPDKSKLSKRQGDVAVEDFLKKGILPETLINFVALLGWHPAGDREIFSLPELVNAFSLKRISKAGAVFDQDKLKWMNGQYLRNLNLNIIAERAKVFFQEKGYPINDHEKYLKLIDFGRQRVSLLSEMPVELKTFFLPPEFGAEDRLILQQEKSRRLLELWADKLNSARQITAEEITTLLQESSQLLEIRGKDLYSPLRLALWGSCHGPDLSLLIDILGREESVNRLQKALRGGKE